MEFGNEGFGGDGTKEGQETASQMIRMSSLAAAGGEAEKRNGAGTDSGG
jgi:hypothetical protein